MITDEGEAIVLEATATDDTLTELKDELNTKSLGRVARLVNKTIVAISGYYTAGGASIIIKRKGEILFLEFLHKVGQQDIIDIDPFTVEANDYAYTFCEAVPT